MIDIMNINILHNVSHEQYWGWFIVFYFFFTGVSAGAVHDASIYTIFGVKSFRPIAKWAALISLLVFIITPFCLIIDLEQSLRFSYFMFLVNPKSAFFYGTILLMLYPIQLVIYNWYLWHEDRWKSSPRFKAIGRLISHTVLPTAIVVHAYTGFVFGVIKGRGFLFTSIMPMYFLMGALVSGAAVVLIFALILMKWEQIRSKTVTITDEMIQFGRKALAWLVAAYPAFVIPLIVMDLYGPFGAYAAGMAAIHEVPFVLGDVIGGLILPIALLTHPRTRTNYFWIAVACILATIGVLAGRYTIVFTGQLVPLS